MNRYRKRHLSRGKIIKVSTRGGPATGRVEGIVREHGIKYVEYIDLYTGATKFAKLREVDDVR